MAASLGLKLSGTVHSSGPVGMSIGGPFSLGDLGEAGGAPGQGVLAATRASSMALV